MPSPIAHLTVGYLLGRCFSGKLSIRLLKKAVPFQVPILLALFFSIAPDADAIVGIATGDLGRYHNNLSHSLVVGTLVSLAAAVILRFAGVPFLKGWLFMFSCYGLHVVMDFFTVGRGVMAFWPVSDMRFQSPLKIFYGLHWSDGLLSWRHVVTVANEVVFAAILLFLLRRLCDKYLDRHDGTGMIGDL